MPMHANYFSIYLFALIVLILYRRVRRNIGWQLFKRHKMESRIVFCSLISLLLLYASLHYPVSLASDTIGIILGLGLAFLGIRHTELKIVDAETHYKPNLWIGGVVTLLFLFRFSFRILYVFQSGAMGTGESEKGIDFLQTFRGNSWTAGLMLILFSYYIAYYAFLLRRQNTAAAS